jgi:hypothetical protein
MPEWVCEAPHSNMRGLSHYSPNTNAQCKCHSAPTLFEEVGDLLAAGPSSKQLLAFRPSEQVQSRYRELLHRSSQGTLTREEQYEFSQFELLEMLLQYVKAKIRANKNKRT